MKSSLPCVACLLLLALQPSRGDDDDHKWALVVSQKTKDLIEQKETSEFFAAISGKEVAKTGAGGCAVGAILGGIVGALFAGAGAGAGAAVGCKAGALLTGIMSFANQIGTQWSEQMRRAMLAWEIWKRSHKHLHIPTNQDERAAYRKCAQDVHPDKAGPGTAPEDVEFMKEMFADCKFAGEYVKAFKAKYGVYNFGQKKDFLKKFAGAWVYAFAGEQQITPDEIDRAAGKTDL